MKVSNLILAGFSVALVIGVFALLFNSITTGSTAVISDYDASQLASFNKSAELVDLAENINQTLFTVEDRNLLDLIGSYISTAISGVKAAFTSISMFNAMIVDAINIFKLPAIFIYVLEGMLVISFLFFVISMMVNKNA